MTAQALKRRTSSSSMRSLFQKTISMTGLGNLLHKTGSQSIPVSQTKEAAPKEVQEWLSAYFDMFPKSRFELQEQAELAELAELERKAVELLLLNDGFSDSEEEEENDEERRHLLELLQ
jgi:hypothetical protein